MNNLFDKSDVLTVVTAEQAKVGDRGYFGNSWLDLQEAIKNNYLASIATIFTGRCDCFMNNAENTIYGLFLPLDKVKDKEPTYRPLKNIDELFRFLTPDFEIRHNEKSNRYKKVETLLRRKITIRRKEDNFIKVMVITDIYFYDNDDNNDIYLNGDSLKYLFCKYEILRNGEWQPFGIKVEEQDSERSNDKDVDNSLSDYMDKRIIEIAKE